MQGALSLIQDVHGGSSQDNGAGLALGYPTEVHQAVFPIITSSISWHRPSLTCPGSSNVDTMSGPCHQGQTLHTIEVSMLCRVDQEQEQAQHT